MLGHDAVDVQFASLRNRLVDVRSADQNIISLLINVSIIIFQIIYNMNCYSALQWMESQKRKILAGTSLQLFPGVQAFIKHEEMNFFCIFLPLLPQTMSLGFRCLSQQYQKHSLYALYMKFLLLI